MNALDTYDKSAGTQIGAGPSGARHSASVMSLAAFNDYYNIGLKVAPSPLWPKHLAGANVEQGAATVAMVIDIADRLRENFLTVAQNIYFVNGRPGWNATFMIAKANNFGVFSDRIDWRIEGKGDDLAVTAFAKLKDSGREVAHTVTMKMAEAEGWTKNPKYKSMPEIMLRYRSATALIRLYCAEVMIGMPPSYELEDEPAPMRDVTPADASAAVIATLDPEEKAPAPRTVDRTPPKAAPVPEPEEKPKASRKKAEAKVDEIDQETGEVLEGTAEAEPETQPEPKEEPKATQQEPDLELPAEDDPPPMKVDWAKFHAGLISDLDFADLDAVKKHHGERLARMEKEAPEAFAKLEREVQNKLNGGSLRSS